MAACWRDDKEQAMEQNFPDYMHEILGVLCFLALEGIVICAMLGVLIALHVFKK